MRGFFLRCWWLKLGLRLHKLAHMKHLTRAFLLLVLPAWLAAVEVYRDPDSGNGVEFSDQASAASQRITVLPPATIPALARPSPAPSAVANKTVLAAVAYTRLAITQPADGATLRNDIDTDVAVELTPMLQTALGHRIEILLDGKSAAEPGTSTRITLHQIARGAHVLRASVVDAEGELLGTSPPSTFYLHRAD